MAPWADVLRWAIYEGDADKVIEVAEQDDN